MLRCPVCKEALVKIGNSYQCKNKHHFDIAKQGYTNLYLKASKHSGDNKEMIAARTTFLNLHYYDHLVVALLKMIYALPANVILDAGCGEGYYTNLLEKNINATCYAFDLSKDALKYAAKQNKNIHYFLSSIFDLPMADECCDILLNIFAPLANDEFKRVIKKGGYLIKVDPHIEHLKEMKQILYDNVYDNEVLQLNIKGFTLLQYEEVTYQMRLDNPAIHALFKMTPYHYKTRKEKAMKLLAKNELHCTASFMIYLYQKNSEENRG